MTKMKNNLNQLEELLDSLPDNLANLQLPDPGLLMLYTNMNERVLWLDADITEGVLNLSKQIIEWNRQDKGVPVEERTPIKIMIYSYGGDLHACMSLIDTMLISKTPIYTYNMGVAMSAGLLILLAGHKRFCTKKAQALIHSGSSGTQGSYEQVQAASKNYEKIIDITRNYVLERTKIDKTTFNKYKSKEWYLYAEDQVKYGIVDFVIENIDDLL